MGEKKNDNLPLLMLLFLVLLLPLSADASRKIYIAYMGEKKHEDPSMVTASHHQTLASVLGSKDEALESMVYSYKHGFFGFAAKLTGSQAKELAKLPEVISVKPNTYHQVQTTRSWDFLGLNYYQPSELLKKANYGKDIIVGVVDTGIWPESQSFDDSGYGPVPKRWRGVCQTGKAFKAKSCNRKIIGARWYVEDIQVQFPPEALTGEYMSARDFNGHGTHTDTPPRRSPGCRCTTRATAAWAPAWHAAGRHARGWPSTRPAGAQGYVVQPHSLRPSTMP